MKSREIKDRFTKYFQSHKHSQLPSSSLIPEDDPTLLFANAGMNQFKNFFTGAATPANPRAVTIQKCVRAGGKHNDLENVGLTARHHTFFEMLGNFSFGDYFKKEAIELSWKFLTEELKISKDKLYVTIHHSDDEAKEIWMNEIGVDESRIFKKGDKDNFWSMGDLGPCGPCSEIFYDHGEENSTPNFKPKDGQDILDDELRYVEIWNLVFMQYEQTPEGRVNLPKPSIDTGAGLERLAAVMQGVYWNYDTDCFAPVLKELEKVTQKKYTDLKYQTAMRVVADHARSTTLLITDGVIPSNEGRGYVLRRIIRRAVRFLREIEAPKGTLSSLSKIVLEELKSDYPQNYQNAELAQKFLKLEEEKFLETLDNGLKFLEDQVIKLNLSKGSEFPADLAFKLYDTFGFPFDLTQLILSEKEIETSESKFLEIMEENKDRSRKTWKGGSLTNKEAFFSVLEKHGPTKFLGYGALSAQSKIIHIEKYDDSSDLIILNETPFYAESGGQAGDLGTINECEVQDCIKPIPELHAHLTSNDHSLSVGQEVSLQVNPQTRELTARNHSATHLVQAALIEILGGHVKQAGSHVSHDRLRFDFTHTQAMTEKQVKDVENLVNQKIKESLPVTVSMMTKDQALEAGALALFGEKYGDEVRVLQMGSFSTELCGGTHVNNTNEIQHIVITSESSLSSGIRRLEAITSSAASKHLEERRNLVSELETILNVKSDQVLEKIKSLQQELKNSRKENSSLKDKIQSLESKDVMGAPSDLGNGILYVEISAPEGSDLRKMSDEFASSHPEGTALIIDTNDEEKAKVLLRAPKSQSKVHCGNLLKKHLPLINGRGGGKPYMAQGSGEKGQLDSFISSLKNELSAL